MNLENQGAMLVRNIERVAPDNGIQKKLAQAEREQRPLRIKLGFDPTSPDLHLGHAVVLGKLREFQDLGHQIVLIVGGFTARVGDPTGRNKTRPPLSPEAIDANAKTYLDQFGKVLDISRVEVRNNCEWLESMTVADILKLMSSVTVSQIMQRTDFAERFSSQLPISMHEILYPLLQAYDSVHIKADIELGGNDQLFNCMLGRELQISLGQAPQAVVSMPLLVGLDGTEKMSKSKANYIGLTDEPTDMFGKVMSVPDVLLPNYLDLTTTFDQATISKYKFALQDGSVNPIEIKKKIALDVTTRYWSAEDASSAEQTFRLRFQERAQSDAAFQNVAFDSLGVAADASLIDVCRGLMKDLSGSELRRLFKSNAVRLDGVIVTDFLLPFPHDLADVRLKIGKRGFFHVHNRTK